MNKLMYRSIFFLLFIACNLSKKESATKKLPDTDSTNKLTNKELVDGVTKSSQDAIDLQKYEISYYNNNDSYFITDIDVNNDTILDKIISSKPYEGDELLLFIKKKEGYKLALKTNNFSEDGGNQIKDIQKTENGFVVITSFPDRGFFESHFFISFQKDEWILTNTIYKTKSSNQEDAFLYVCDVKQGINISDSNFLQKLKQIPDESDRNNKCIIQNISDMTSLKSTSKELITQATIDSVSINEIKYYSEKLPTIFEYYNYEKIDKVEIWSEKMFGICCSEADLSYSELLEFDITANLANTKYPYSNLSDERYTTAFVFKENEKSEITIKLKRNEETHQYYTKLIVDDVLKSKDTILKPFKLSLVNGYVKSEKTYSENGRIQELKILLNDNYKGTIKLQDTPLIQQFELDFVFTKDDVVKLIPITYYKGTKYDDICISEIQSSLAQITHPSINKKYKVRDLWQQGNTLRKAKK